MKNKKKERPLIKESNSIWSAFYWRKKYNTVASELEVLKQVMASDVYAKVIKNMEDPLENKRLKLTVERLNNKVSFLQEERNKLYDEVKALKKKGGTIKDGKEEG